MDLVSIFSIIASVAAVVALVPIYKSRKEKNEAIRQEKDDMYANCIAGLGDTKGLVDVLESGPFIPVHAQKEGPHDNADYPLPSKDRYKLVPKLLSDILPDKGRLPNKRMRYAILAGSGMGKSIFSASFCKSYIENKEFKNKKLPYFIYAINLAGMSIDEIESQISKNITHPQKTILILDSLDENPDANKNYSAFIKKLEDVIDNIKVVILTVRTQFYANSQEEPKRGSKNQHSDKAPTLNWEIHYLSPFTPTEVQQYVDMKYNINSKEYPKAYKLIHSASDLMNRPLILAYLDDLLDIKPLDGDRLTYVEIYNEIINAWLKREIRLNPYSNMPDVDNDGSVLADLYAFTKDIAVYVSKSNGFCVPKDEYENFLKKYEKDGVRFAFKGRSLLNRTSNGDVKFAHKSFLEFFIAIDSLEHPEKQYDTKGFDLAQLFAKELFGLYRHVQSAVKKGIVDTCKKRFENAFSYVSIARSPFIIRQNDKDVINPDFFDDWIAANQTEEIDQDGKHELNSYNLYKYLKTLLFSRNRQPKYIDWEFKLFSIQDEYALYSTTLTTEDVDLYKKIEFDDPSEDTRTLCFGNRLDNLESVNFITAGQLKVSDADHSEIIFPSFADHIEDNELTFTIGNGFIESNEPVFEEIKKLCERQSDEVSIDIQYKHKAEDGTLELVKEEKVYPVVILTYKETSDELNLEQAVSQQINYIRELMEYLGNDISLGKEIVINFMYKSYSYYYLIDYNSIIYSNQDIEECLYGLFFGSMLQAN